MRSKLEQKPLVPQETVISAINNVNKRHYLGAANHKTNPTGGLNGYYRNIAAKVYSKFEKLGESRPSFWVYLMDACVTHSGAGNCGELAGALYLELFIQNLSFEQKKLIHYRSYITHDEHLQNSYVLVDSTVYDIWANKKYKASRIKAETMVAEKFHTPIAFLDPGIPAEFLIRMKELILAKFTKLFEEEITKDRKTGRMYVTLDNTDPSDYALWASDAFLYLFNKFKETIEDPYFKTNRHDANIIQEKIIKDYTYLIEELRQDIPLSSSSSIVHPDKIQYTHEQVANELQHLIPSQLFVDFVLAISYKNTNKQLALELLIKLQSSLHNDLVNEIDLALVSRISEELNRNSEANNIELNPHQFFSDISKSNDTQDSSKIEGMGL